MPPRLAETPPIRFTPAPGKARHDGWDPRAPARLHRRARRDRSVTRACAAAGMSTATAYALRRRTGAESFAAAWSAALAFMPAAAPPRAPGKLVKAGKTNKVRELDDPPNRPPFEELLRQLRQLGRHPA